MRGDNSRDKSTGKIMNPVKGAMIHHSWRSSSLRIIFRSCLSPPALRLTEGAFDEPYGFLGCYSPLPWSQGLTLNMEEKFALATKPKRGSRNKRHEHGRLPNEVELALGMKVMVTFNVSTNLDMTNGARGHIVGSTRRERGETSGRTHSVRLQYPPLYVLMSINWTKVSTLDGLEPGIFPVAPLTRTFVVTTANGNGHRSRDNNCPSLLHTRSLTTVPKLRRSNIAWWT